MKVPKEKTLVNIICNDGSRLEGWAYMREGMRLIDDLNRQEKSFLVITDATFFNIKAKLFGLHKNIFTKKKKVIILNKNSIKWVEEKKNE